MGTIIHTKLLKLLLISLFGAVVVFMFMVMEVYAQQQYQTKSNTVTTRIGNPPISVSVCPIPNGTINCGSKNVPVNGCGHCGIGYEAYMKNCTYEGIYYAMDIGGNDFQDVILPSVGGASIEWTFSTESHRTSNQAIQLYSGTNLSTGEKYWIQFHHTRPGSGNPGTHTSGERGGNICGDSCEMKHVHIEFAKIDTSGKTIWLDSPDYFCKK